MHMPKLHEKLGLSEEQLQEFMKNPQSFDPQLREKISKAASFSVLKFSLGLVLAIVLFGGGILYGINYLTGTIIEQTAELPGDAVAFDPIAALPAVQSHAGAAAELLSIDAQYVKSDGTLDLTITDPYRPRVEYEFFIRDDSAGKEAPPLGAGGIEGGFYNKKVSVDVYEPGQWRHVRSMGSGGSSEYSYQNKGMDRDEGSLVFDNPRPAPAPACSFGELWQVAMEMGAPADALAGIRYNLTYDGEPRYEFRIEGSNHKYEFKADCQIVN
jgi:hypothetical protein